MQKRASCVSTPYYCGGDITQARQTCTYALWHMERQCHVPCAGNHRKLRVTAQPNVSLTLEHVPQHCRRAKTILLGPLTPTDLDAAAFVHQQHGVYQPA